LGYTKNNKYSSIDRSGWPPRRPFSFAVFLSDVRFALFGKRRSNYNIHLRQAAYRIEYICVHVAAACIWRCSYPGEHTCTQGGFGTFP
jgi:hypothetical protein